MQELCPNCGQRLVNYRVDRQRAGDREVTLRWSICEHCRHVGLREWHFLEPELVAEAVPTKEVQYQEGEGGKTQNGCRAGC